MKTAALVVLGLAAAAAVVVLTEPKAAAAPGGGGSKGATPPPPGPSPVDPSMAGWALANWDAALAAYPELANQEVNALVPMHSYLTGADMATTLGDAPPGVLVGTVNDWIHQQRAAGHRVFMSPTLVTSTGSGWAFSLDVPPSGWTEVKEQT